MRGKTDINIQHPEVWELLVSIDDRQVDYVLFTPTVKGSLQVGTVTLADASLSSLEDAIYDTPELLGEYKRARVVVHSRHFVLLPADVDDDDCVMLVRHAFPTDDGDAAVCPVPGSDVKIAYMAPRGLLAFWGRTFNYPVMCHHLAPLCQYCQGQTHEQSAARMLVHLGGDAMDVAIYRDDALLCANTYPYTNAQDAAYFALGAWRAHSLDQLSDPMLLAGDGALQAAVAPVLRDYVKHVMPAVYPAAAMQLGRNAMRAPLELVLLALCE